MTETAQRTELDWPLFVAEDWNQRPVVFRQPPGSPFIEDEVFAAAAAVTAPHCQFTIERHQQLNPGPYLPVESDSSFDGYERRLADWLDGRRYALIVDELHSFGYPMWDRERTFFAGLWELVGLPLTGAITSLFHGTYEHSPVGVHQDRFTTFMVGMRGRKRMRFWPRRPWAEPVTTMLDYRPHVATSFAVEIGPGDILYWPDSYYHVGESVGTDPATSVNIGIPRTEHRVAYELGDLTIEPAGSPSAFWPGAAADGQLSAVLPDVLTETVRGYQLEDLEAWARRVSTRKWAADGFEPAPETAR